MSKIRKIIMGVVFAFIIVIGIFESLKYFL